MMIFFSFICCLDLDVAGSGSGSVRCVRVPLFSVWCVSVYLASFCAACHGTWFILGQYQVGHILIYFYGILFIQKFDEFFFLFFWNQSNVRNVRGGLYSIWLESHIAVFIRFQKILLVGGIACIASHSPNIPQHLLFFLLSCVVVMIFFGWPSRRSSLLSVAMCRALSNWSLFQQCLMQ